MENYNQSSQNDENRPSGTTPNQYGNQQDRGQRMQIDEHQSPTIDDDTRYDTDQRSSDLIDSDRDYSEGSSQRPNQYSNSMAPGDQEDDMDDDDKSATDMDDEEDMDDDMDMDSEDDAEQDSSATPRSGNDLDMRSTF